MTTKLVATPNFSEAKIPTLRILQILGAGGEAKRANTAVRRGASLQDVLAFDAKLYFSLLTPVFYLNVDPSEARR